MLILLAAFAIGALVAPAIMRLGRLGYVVLAAIPASSFVYLLAHVSAVMRADFLWRVMPGCRRSVWS